MTGNGDSTIHRTVARYYSERLAAHGPTPRGVDWNSHESQTLRHRQFLRLIDDRDSSVLDLGCGFGDFLRFLRQEGYSGPYLGFDVAPNMIMEAERLHRGVRNVVWRVGAVPDESADFAVASGIFNVKGNIADAEWSAYVERTIRVLARAGRKGFGFNILSVSSDPERRRSDLHYADPAAMLGELLKQYGRSVAILQDYGLFEFTAIVRRDIT